MTKGKILRGFKVGVNKIMFIFFIFSVPRMRESRIINWLGMDLKAIFALLTMLSCQFKRSLETLNLGSHMEISKSFTIILQRLRYVYPNLLIVSHIFFRWLFLHKKGDWRSQISWLFLIHYGLSETFFFTVFWGDLEGAGRCPPHSSYIQKPCTIRVNFNY